MGQSNRQAEHEAVESSRRLLRAILSRRDFLATASGIATGIATGASALSLAACGGGGDSPTSPTTPTTPTGPTTPTTPTTPTQPAIPDGLQTVAGTVSLPPGSTLKLTDLTVDVLTQQMPVSTSGGFTIGVSSTAPSLGLLLDRNGDGVMMSMFDPTGLSYAVSPRTTAVSLLYYGVGAYNLPADKAFQVLQLLRTDPAVAALESVVSSAVASDPLALANSAPTLAPAITVALQTILGTSASTASLALRASPHASIVPRANASAITSSTVDAVPTLMKITPSEAQNGVQVDQAPTTTALLVTNVKRRPCRVYVYETATLRGAAAGTPVTTDVTPAKRIAGPIDIDSTESLSLFTSLKDILRGLSPWSPVSMPPLPLALEPNTDGTTYQVIVLAGASTAYTPATLEPTFFRDPHFANELETWRADYKQLSKNVIFGDLLLPLFCMLGGVGAIVVAHAELANIVKAAEVTYKSTFNTILSQIEFGSVGQLRAGLAKVVQAAISSDLSSQFWKAEVQQVVGRVEARALSSESVVQSQTRLARASKLFRVFDVLLGVGIALDAFDLGALILDFFSSDLGAAWEAKLLRQLLTLNPQNPGVPSGERVTFGVNNPANVTGTIEYDWTHTSAFATLSAVGEANTGRTITTTKRNVDLVTTPSDVSPINVLVVGYDKSSGTRVEIGRAATTVRMIVPALILPGNAMVDIGERRTFTASMPGTVPVGAKYRWTLTGVAGSIGASPVLTDVPSIVYLGNVTGTDQLQVEIFNPGGDLVAKGTTSVMVAPENSVEFLISGTWDPIRTPANGSYTFKGPEGARSGGLVDGADAIFFSYNIAADDTIGVLVTMMVPVNAPVREGQAFSKFVPGRLPRIGEFQLTLSQDQNDVENSTQWAPVGTGLLTIDSVGQLANGTWVTHYLFRCTNGGGGVIAGSGWGRWKGA